MWGSSPVSSSGGSSLLRHVEAEGVEGVFVGGGGAVGFNDDGEAALVIPHGPADVVLLQSDAHIVEPLRAGGGGREVTKDAELSTVDGDVVERGPLRGELDGVLDAGCIPAILSVFIEEVLTGERGLFVEFGRDVFWC